MTGTALHRAGLSVYYGPPCPDALSVLARQATVVVQSGLYTPAQLARLRRTTHVLGYLSLGEDHPLGTWACVPGSAPYHTGVNPAWGSVRVDARHPAWRATVLGRAALALAHTDGVLLDTLDSADPDATLGLARALRERWPHVTLYANRGFPLLPDLAPLIDGVLIEAFSTTHAPAPALHDPDGLAYTAHWLREVRALGLDVHALDYADTPALAAQARARADTEGVATFVTTRALDLPGGHP
ncbi:hypothetical protein HNQ07_001066 [Deinococcus metalli]|uniref:Glycoside-hydrolase family GH114 TIM-barrel domain-containing protein n=1 Tax=Deinococcus metalli TaxID=1141878 RepID=A0A7W8KCE4_9DEIO|nr:hypothetical protein [Deinococcus metalli]MBB5375609.1 hypothetical protein [Deinococcus metalli]GHF38408.1 hypothetical protein GCM10017781_13920 [Deinococcus metalli]